MRFTVHNSEFGLYPDEPEFWELRFSSVGRDHFGRWVVKFEQNSRVCHRPIQNSDGFVIRERKPLGSELLTAVSCLVGRSLTPEEEEQLLDLPVIN